MIIIGKKTWKTITDARQDKRYNASLQLYGNDKLKDYYNPETGVFHKYAQYNTIAGVCCPFASIGCALACYAKTGCHLFPSTKKARQRSYNKTLEKDFAKDLIFTLEIELQSKRYLNNHMLLRIHESGDFYSLEYLKKWVKIFKHFVDDTRITNCFYTKSFKYLLELSAAEKAVINKGLKNNTIAMSLSLDDTTTPEQIALAMKCKKEFPLANIYYCAENPEEIKHDNKCDCSDCAKCGTCTKTTGTTTVVKIHSVTETQKEKYHKNRRK